MIRVIAIDDEPLALRQLEMYMAKVPFLELVAACSSAAMAAPYVAKADALFLDINMPDLSRCRIRLRSFSRRPIRSMPWMDSGSMPWTTC